MPLVLIEQRRPGMHEVRAYDDTRAPWDARHDLAMNLFDVDGRPGVAEASMLTATGPQSLRMMRALLSALIRHGLREVIAYRRDGHTLPGARKVGPNEWSVDLHALARRKGRP